MSTATGMILIVDDDMDDVELMRSAFRKLGKNNPMHVAADGNCALAYLDGEGIFADRNKYPLPFIIILDWKLLGLSGLDVLTRIRSRQKAGKPCVVVFSGSEYARDREAALNAGADLFLQKPNSHFVDAVKTIIQFWGHCQPPE